MPSAFAGSPIISASGNPSGTQAMSTLFPSQNKYSFEFFMLYCPTCGTWVKTFSIPDGTQTGTAFEIDESIGVDPFSQSSSPPIADWHQRITSANAHWETVDPGNFDTRVVGNFGTLDPTVLELALVVFDFPPVPDNGLFTIHKQFIYTGPNVVETPGAPGFTGPINVVIEQWPTIQTVTVGGELIPIDTSSLLVAGAQMNASWMIPVIVSGIGFAIVIARKF